MTGEEPKYQRQERYKGFINYEGLLNQQINRIAEHLSAKKMELFEISVDTLIYMFPLDLRNKALKYKKEHNIEYDLSLNGVQAYVRLWLFCNELLEKNNLIFKSSYIKTYE